MRQGLSGCSLHAGGSSVLAPCERKVAEVNEVITQRVSPTTSTWPLFLLTMVIPFVCDCPEVCDVEGLADQYRSIPNEMSLSIVILK